jgi:uncharacterized membrane protein YphA (DoxX/SURF4 family)
MPTAWSARLFWGLALLCRLGLAAVLLYAAWPKLLDPAGFAKAVANYHIVLPVVGRDYINATALFLPALELVLGLVLIAGIWKRGAGLLTAALMILFVAAISSAMARGLNIDCGCFGATKLGVEIAHKVGLRRLLEDIGYVLMASVVSVEAAVSKRKRIQG